MKVVSSFENGPQVQQLRATDAGEKKGSGLVGDPSYLAVWVTQLPSRLAPVHSVSA
jgi:hypothetical protein